jgi:hypothetical protein
MSKTTMMTGWIDDDLDGKNTPSEGYFYIDCRDDDMAE